MMNRPVFLSLLFSALLLAGGFVDAAPAQNAAASTSSLPGDSFYQLDLPLLDQDGHATHLSALAGKPALLTMFYGNCKKVCPVVIEELKQTVAALSKEKRQGLRVMMISLDPKNDSPAELTEVMHMHQLDPAIFRLAVSDSDAHTRTLAAAIGIKYRRLSSGEINHSVHILLLDTQGRQIYGSDRISSKPDDAMMQAINTALTASAP